MKKNFKTMAAAIAVTGTMAMTMGMSMTAFAADTRNADSKYTTSKDDLTDTGSINLIKDYDRVDGTQEDSVSPAEIFEFTITRYGVWNAGYMDNDEKTLYTKENIPLLGTPNATNSETVVTISAAKDDAGKIKDEKEFFNSTAITIPEYNSVGDFWYQVVETDKKTTGVTYATNDDDNKYYIHVQVTNNTTNTGYIRTVTLHKTAPDYSISNATYNSQTSTENGATSFYNSNKVNDIQNTYSAGTLTVGKIVQGNAGDKNKRFAVQVTFTKPENTIINSDITFTAAAGEHDDATNQTIVGQGSSGSGWKNGTTVIDEKSLDSATNTVTIWIKDSENVVFKNIPYGVTYTVQEMNPENKYSNDKYEKPEYSLSNNESNDKVVEINSSAWNGKQVQGNILDKNDTVTITNEKKVSIDVGVLLSNAPYAAMLALAGTAGVVFVKRRKKDIED